MTRYLLDTTALIDFSKGREPARSRILQMIAAGHEVGICAVNVAEFYSGLPAVQRARWQPFLSSLLYWDIPLTIATRAGIDRFDLARAARTISATDALIAAVARHESATLITENVKDFQMSGIPLLSFHGRAP